MKNENVLLTGVTGYLGSHITIQLLAAGYRVRGTLRQMNRAAKMQRIIGQHTDAADRLTFHEIDLGDAPERWDEALRGIDLVVHTASPFPTTLPKHEDELILPAKHGTLNLLESATRAGVKRVVMTSSSGAAVYGVRKTGTFSETDWTDPENKSDTTPYFRSKVIAERAARDFVDRTPGAPELVTILPGLILGPVLDAEDFGTSANVVKKLLDGSMPALPRIGFGIVDVRSVADAHLRALTVPAAAGNRYLCATEFMTFKDVANVLRAAYPDRSVPSATLPDWLVWLFSVFDKETQPILIDLGAERRLDTGKIERELGWSGIPLADSIRATATSLQQLNILQ